MAAMVKDAIVYTSASLEFCHTVNTNADMIAAAAAPPITKTGFVESASVVHRYRSAFATTRNMKEAAAALNTALMKFTR